MLWYIIKVKLISILREIFEFDSLPHKNQKNYVLKIQIELEKLLFWITKNYQKTRLFKKQYWKEFNIHFLKLLEKLIFSIEHREIIYYYCGRRIYTAWIIKRKSHKICLRNSSLCFLKVTNQAYQLQIEYDIIAIREDIVSVSTRPGLTRQNRHTSYAEEKYDHGLGLKCTEGNLEFLFLAEFMRTAGLIKTYFL